MSSDFNLSSRALPAAMSEGEVGARAVQGSVVSVAASAITLALGFVRLVLLARLLPPEDFGLVTLAVFYVQCAANQPRALGLRQAMIHHAGAHDALYDTYGTLRLGLAALSLGALSAAIPFVSRWYPSLPELQAVMLVLVGVELVRTPALVQESLLIRVMAFRALAVADVVTAVLMTLVASALAWRGWGAWALVAGQASGVCGRFLYVWVCYPQYRVRLGWDVRAARWFWSYGRPAWVATNLEFVASRFADFWVGTVLGKGPLGYYSRAAEFAGYPRYIVLDPLVDVVLATFARLQRDPVRLSHAFERAASLIVRAGFWLAGGVVLVMPEFIALVIGNRWAPMLPTVRLFVVVMLLEALLGAGANLLLATGRPALLARVRLVQSMVIIPGVMIGSALAGIEGVALAVGGAMLAATLLLLASLRRLVDVSPLQLLGAPLLALCLGAAAVLSLEWVVTVGDLTRAVMKIATYSTCYLGCLVTIDRDQCRTLWLTTRQALLRAPAAREV